MIAWLLASLAWGGDAEVVTQVPTPVATLALRDVRSMRRARTGLVMALAAPAVVLVGATSSLAYVSTESKVQFGVGFTAQLLGISAALVAPPLLLHGAWRSSWALRRQGLPVRNDTVVVGAGLYVLSGAVLAISRFQTAPLAIAATLYVASVWAGTVQLRRNQLARRRVGWVGVAPLVRPGTAGIVVAGRF